MSSAKRVYLDYRIPKNSGSRPSDFYNEQVRAGHPCELFIQDDGSYICRVYAWYDNNRQQNPRKGRILPGPAAGSVPVQTRRYCRVCLQWHCNTWNSNGMSTSEPFICYLTPGNGAVTVSVEKKPKRIRGYMDSVTTEEFVKVKEWIKLNYDVLMSNWNEPDSGALCRNVKKV